MSLTDGDRRPQNRDGVRLNVPLRADRVNSSARDMLESNTQFYITRVNRMTVQVRTVELFRVQHAYTTERRARSYVIATNLLDYDDQVGRQATATRSPRRALGKKPDDTEAMTYIGIDHPGVQWIWEDLATYASRQHWCREYDTLAAHVGIPGRPQDFSVSQMHNGIQVTATIRARSEDEARARLAASLNPPQTDPETTPSDPVPQAA